MRKETKGMARILAALLAVALLLGAAGAEGTEGPLTTALKTGTELLFNESNVTLEGEAVFFFDGARFKTATGTYQQDGENSIWDYHVMTPRISREDRRSGYTVVANGRDIFVMDGFYPGTYVEWEDEAQHTLVRRSVMLDQMLSLVELLMKDADGQLFPGIGMAQGETVSISLKGEQIPETVQRALNLYAQGFLRRYFFANYDTISPETEAAIENYITLTQAILYTTRGFTLEQVDLIVERDEKGRLTHMEGEVAATLDMGDNGKHPLSITLKLDARDYGTTKVDPFRPEDFGVSRIDPGAVEPAPGYVAPLTDEKLAQLWGGFRDAWQAAGYGTLPEERGQYDIGSSYGEYYVVYDNGKTGPDHVRLSGRMREDGFLLYIQDQLYPDYISLGQESRKYADDPEKLKEVEEKLRAFLEKVNPETPAKEITFAVNSEYEMNGQHFLVLEESRNGEVPGDPHILFLVQVEPEWKIMEYLAISNG